MRATPSMPQRSPNCWAAPGGDHPGFVPRRRVPHPCRVALRWSCARAGATAQGCDRGLRVRHRPAPGEPAPRREEAGATAYTGVLGASRLVSCSVPDRRTCSPSHGHRRLAPRRHLPNLTANLCVRPVPILRLLTLLLRHAVPVWSDRFVPQFALTDGFDDVAGASRRLARTRRGVHRLDAARHVGCRPIRRLVKATPTHRSPTRYGISPPSPRSPSSPRLSFRCHRLRCSRSAASWRAR